MTHLRSGSLDAEALGAGTRRTVRRARRVVVPLTGRIGLGRRSLPSVVIVGAQRSGTTSLHRALASIPGVQPPRHNKGVHFFDVAYDRGLPWYRAHFPLRRPGSVAMETSPYYLFHPAVPARMAADLPAVRILVLLRDPASRAVSHHRHEVARGFEHLSLEQALDAEAERLEGAEDRLLRDPSATHFSHMHHSYLARGRYVEQLERWYAHLPRERLLVMDANRLFEDPAAGIGEITAFLGLSACGQPTLGHVNGYPRVDFPGQLDGRLKAYFEPHDERLATLLGWRPSWR